MYPKEQFHSDGKYRLVHSLEEHAKFKAEGWSDVREEGVEYLPYTALCFCEPAPVAETDPNLQSGTDLNLQSGTDLNAQTPGDPAAAPAAAPKKTAKARKG